MCFDLAGDTVAKHQSSSHTENMKTAIGIFQSPSSLFPSERPKTHYDRSKKNPGNIGYGPLAMLRSSKVYKCHANFAALSIWLPHFRYIDSHKYISMGWNIRDLTLTAGVYLRSPAQSFKAEISRFHLRLHSLRMHRTSNCFAPYGSAFWRTVGPHD